MQVGYDKAGQRTLAIYGRDGHREDYTYTSDGLLENTYINPSSAAAQGALRASRTNDLMGRVVGYTEYDTNGSTVTRSRSLTFDNDNRQTGQTETYQGATTTTTNTLLGDGTLSKVASTTSGTTTTTSYAYEWWDSAKQSRITEQAYNPALGMNNNRWKPGVAHYTYDVNGHLLGAIDEVGLKSFSYISNAQGQVMLREQAGNGVVQQTHRCYYAEGRTVGDVGNDGDDKQDYAAQLADTSRESNNYTARQKAYKNWRPVSSADFDQNYQPITASYPGTAPGSYTVQAGDSLYTIAASQWGDASLWYLIAEANGLSAASNFNFNFTLCFSSKSQLLSMAFVRNRCSAFWWIKADSLCMKGTYRNTRSSADSSRSALSATASWAKASAIGSAANARGWLRCKFLENWSSTIISASRPSASRRQS